MSGLTVQRIGQGNCILSNSGEQVVVSPGSGAARSHGSSADAIKPGCGAWLYKMSLSSRSVAMSSRSYPSISIRTSAVCSPWAGAIFLVDSGILL